jgi:hypothetical protein
MPSLTAHLRLPEDHSGLSFHPACPVCRRDRLAGSLDGEDLVSRRTQAAIAAGLLAFSGLGVPAAVASEPDSATEGTAEVVEAGDPAISPDLDLEMETQLPDEAAPPDAVAPPTDEDSAPLELETAANDHEPVVNTGQDVAAAEPTPVPPPETVTPTAEEAPVASPTPAPSPRLDSSITALATQPRKAPKRAVRHNPRPAPSVAEPAPAASTPVAEPAPAPTVTTVAVVAGSSGNRAAPGDRLHVVRPGESLWSIAADVLGDRATVARVAREVDRLWELNDERIHTGDPNLLFAGTRLVLR